MRHIFKYVKKIIPASLKPFFKKAESAFYFSGAMGINLDKWLTYFKLHGPEKYKYMQKMFYEHNAKISKYENESDLSVNEFIVGNYQAHNNWIDNDIYLFRYIDFTAEKKNALDFACGPGRNILKYHAKFKRLDGVDISENNLKNARKQLDNALIKNSSLFISSGDDLGNSPKQYYDLIFSTIALQHISSHSIRYKILEAMYSALVDGGRISIQMVYGVLDQDKLGSVDYKENYYSALATNSQHDCIIQDPKDVERDLREIGYRNFEYWIRPGGPGTRMGEDWIYFTAVK